jgi:hypothetical protein
MPTDVLSPEQLDGPNATREWTAFREKTNGGDWGIPNGTYEGSLRDVSTVKRKDTGQWVVRMLALLPRRDRYALAWVGLSDHPDPYELTPGQSKALQKVAQGFGFALPSAPEEIVDQIGHLVGHDVEVHVFHTPIGPRATFSSPPATNGEVVDERVELAHRAQTMLLAGLRAARSGLIHSAEACYLLLENQAWDALGYESLNEWLANPEIGLSKTVFYDLANIHQRYVLEGGVSQERLTEGEHSKLTIPLRALAAAKVSANEAADDAAALGWRDLRAKYRDLMAEPAPDGDPGPEEPGICESCGRPL